MPILERQNTDSDQGVDNSLNDDLRGYEQRHIIEALENNNGARRATANELGISERTLRYKITRFREQGVDIPEKVGKKSA
jgi:two-component system response regulator FlrC